MQETGWKRADLVRIAGVSSSLVSQWLGKGSKPISEINKLSAAENLAARSGFSAMWIARGIGPQRQGSLRLVSDAKSQTIEPWPFKRISAQQLNECDPAILARLEGMIEAVLNDGTSTYIETTPTAWRRLAMNIAESVDAVTQNDQFKRFVEAVDTQFSKAAAGDAPNGKQ